MKLTRQEIWCLRVADGVSTSSDEDRLRKVGINPDDWRDISKQIGAALRSDEDIDLCAPLSKQLDWNIMSIGEFLRDSKVVSLVDEVMSNLEVDVKVPERITMPTSVAPKPLNLDLMSALTDPTPPDIADSIMASILDENYSPMDQETVLDESEHLDEIDTVANIFATDLESEVDNNTDSDDDLLINAESVHFDDEESQEEVDYSLVEETHAEEDEFVAVDDIEDLDNLVDLESVAGQKVHLVPKNQIVLEKISSDSSSEEHNTNIVQEDEQEAEIENVTAVLEEEHIENVEPINVADNDRKLVASVPDENELSELLANQEAVLGDSLANALRYDGEVVDLWGDVQHALQKPPLRLVRANDVSENVEELDNDAASVEFFSTKTIDADSTISKLSLTILGGLMAAAAAVMLFVLPKESIEKEIEQKTLVAFELAEVNELEVEELETADNVSVQIFQTEENGPTIIFIDDFTEPEGEE
jgi:hypothetical protein